MGIVLPLSRISGIDYRQSHRELKHGQRGSVNSLSRYYRLWQKNHRNQTQVYWASVYQTQVFLGVCLLYTRVVVLDAPLPRWRSRVNGGFKRYGAFARLGSYAIEIRTSASALPKSPATPHYVAPAKE